jgi:hypothetical protein
LFLLVACDDPAVSGLEGQWAGSISCATSSSGLTLLLQVLGDTLGGTAVTRTQEVDTKWEVKGSQQEAKSTESLVEGIEREPSCSDDSCINTSDCADRGGGVCNAFGLCEPCDDGRPWRRVTLNLKDDDVQSIDPVIVLERFGDVRMTGTIQSFCTDEDKAPPHVAVEKD